MSQPIDSALRDKIVELIQVNKISTTEVADVLGKTGHLDGILPINRQIFKAGIVEFIYTHDGSNYEMHRQIQSLPKGRIAYIHPINCAKRAVMGDLVSKYLYLYRQAAAVVVDGYVRDVHRLIKEQYPLWARGVTPIGCVNAKPEKPAPTDVVDPLRERFSGGIIVCDDSGVVLIEPRQITPELYEKLNLIELQEDLWYYCIDSEKMSTFDVVCNKKYLTDPELMKLPRVVKLKEFLAGGPPRK